MTEFILENIPPFWFGCILTLVICLTWAARSTKLIKYCLLFSTVLLLLPLPVLLTAGDVFAFDPVYDAANIWRWFFVGGVLTPVGAYWLIQRYANWGWSFISSFITKRFSRQRTGRTDIRSIEQHLPNSLKKPYDPSIFFNSRKGFFVGLSLQKKPIYLSHEAWKKSHVQVMGTTGAGKGVAAGLLLSQAVRFGETVIVFDPKNDEYLPHVLHKAAQDAGKPYAYIDLQASNPQWNPLLDKTADQIDELLCAGFDLGEKGSEGDFYRVADRRVVRQFAKFCENRNENLPHLFARFFSEPPESAKDAAKLFADLEELADTASAQATRGIDIPAALEAGGVIYIRGSTRNPRILKLQRIFLLSCMQWIEARTRSEANHVAIFMDEFKYVLSRPALEALGAIRDKRAHVLVAHQSLGDLKDCSSDLTADAVIGAVVENCAIKYAYQVRDPDTADWLSRLSGTILIDDETRVVERNFGLAEVQKGERMLRQAEKPLVDPNQLLSLPNRCAVLFGVGTAQYIFTSPMPVTISDVAITPHQTGEQQLTQTSLSTPATPAKRLGEALLDVD